MRTKAEITDAMMNGTPTTEAEIYRLYKGMPLVAKAIWNNIEAARTTEQQSEAVRENSVIVPASPCTCTCVS